MDIFFAICQTSNGSHSPIMCCTFSFRTTRSFLYLVSVCPPMGITSSQWKIPVHDEPDGNASERSFVSDHLVT